MLKFNLDKANCVGCSACYSVCPNHSITMKMDKEGFLYPFDSDTCIGCGLCEKVCPIVNSNKENAYPKRALAAVAKDYYIWHRSASGGAFSEIVRHWADDDTLIVGAAWDGLKVHHIGVIGFENIAPLCKSKYISSAIEDTFIEVRKHLKARKKVIFCGCPCQVDGLKSFLMKEYDNLLTIDLICHGQGSPLVFNECMKLIGEQLGEEVIGYEFRAKRRVYEQDYLALVSTTNTTHYLARDPYMQLFLSQDALRPSCGVNCKYRDIRRPGDLTIADCKGLSHIFPDLIGTRRNYSTIVSNTQKGEFVLLVLPQTMETRECSIDDVIKYNPLFAKQTWFSSNRDVFFEEFNKNPKTAIQEHTDCLLLAKWTIKIFIRSYFPTFILKTIYRLKFKII